MYCKFILYERNNARVSNICLPAGRTCVCVWGGKMMRIAEPAYANTDWKQLGLDDRYSNSSAFWLSNEAIAFANSIFAYMDVVFLLQKDKERFGDAYHIGFNRFENRKKKTKQNINGARTGYYQTCIHKCTPSSCSSTYNVHHHRSVIIIILTFIDFFIFIIRLIHLARCVTAASTMHHWYHMIMHLPSQSTIIV